MRMMRRRDVDDGSSKSGPESPKERFLPVHDELRHGQGGARQPARGRVPTTIDEVDEVSEHEGAHPLEGCHM